jgi:hypothetical protein
MDWVRGWTKKSSDRRIGVWAALSTETETAWHLTLTDEDGHTGRPKCPALEAAKVPEQAKAGKLREQLSAWAHDLRRDM